MVVSCVVTGCSDRHKLGTGIAFHRIPNIDKFPEKHRRWINAIARKNFVAQTHHRVCGRHFISGRAVDDPTSPDYVPTINLGYGDHSMLSPENKDKRHKRSKQRSEKKAAKAIEEESAHSAAKVLVDLSASFLNHQLDDQPVKENVTPSSSSAGRHDTCLKKIVDLEHKLQQVYLELGLQQERVRTLEAQNEDLTFDDSFLGRGNKNERTKQYTGLPNHQSFLWLVDYCQYDMSHFRAITTGSQILLILMKLRLNILNSDLAIRFGISTGVVSDVLNKGLPVLAMKLAFLINWPDKEHVQRTMPKIFRTSQYSSARVIIDCAEIFIERPGNLTARAMTWSNYKHHNTIKILVGISPTGSVTFVSRAFGGRTSDTFITQRSGFLDLIEHGDLVIADRGFLISEDLAARNSSLLIPAFTRGQKQLSQPEMLRRRESWHMSEFMLNALLNAYKTLRYCAQQCP